MMSSLTTFHAITTVGCDKCDLASLPLNQKIGKPLQSRWFSMGWFPMAIVGMNPSKSRKVDSVIFSSPLMLKWLRAFRRQISSDSAIFITNLVRCATPDNQIINHPSALAECPWWLATELSLMEKRFARRPLALLCGKEVQKYFGIKSDYTVYEVPINGIVADMIGIYHPAYSARWGDRLESDVTRLHETLSNNPRTAKYARAK